MMMQQPGQPIVQPGQPMMQQPMVMSQPTVVIMQQPGLGGQRGHESYPLIWQETATVVTCHYCKFQGPTKVERKLTDVGWMVCCMLCFFCVCCVCVACCLDSMNIYTHYCNNCNKPLGARSRGMSIYY